MNELLHSTARLAHRSPFLRAIARKVASGVTLSQSFHGGVICLDAVEHSWAWTGTRWLETFERPVQDRLCELLATRSRFVDIGSSIGVMTLSALLRLPHVSTVSIDAAPRAIDLLRRSIQRNRLDARARTESCAVSNGETQLAFADAGSFTGHVSANGAVIPATPLLHVLQQHAADPCVVKIDIEGYEAVLADTLRHMPPLPGSVLVLKAHPLGFNGFGDPVRVIRALQDRGDARVHMLGGGAFSSLVAAHFHQIEVHWDA